MKRLPRPGALYNRKRPWYHGFARRAAQLRRLDSQESAPPAEIRQDGVEGSAGIEGARQSSDDLMAALELLGPEGVRAAEMFVAASDQLLLGGARAGNLVLYCTREALMSLSIWPAAAVAATYGGSPGVVAVANLFRDGRGSHQTLLEAASALDAALDGPGPHAHRLNSLITKLHAWAPERGRRPAGPLTSRSSTSSTGGLHSDIDLASAGELNRQALVAVGPLFGDYRAGLLRSIR